MSKRKSCVDTGLRGLGTFANTDETREGFDTPFGGPCNKIRTRSLLIIFLTGLGWEEGRKRGKYKQELMDYLPAISR